MPWGCNGSPGWATADSGMTGWAQNSEEGAFTGADVDEAAGRLAAILDEEDADFLVGYDWHGGYGHPDHVKVHPVVHRAAELAARRPAAARVDDEPRHRPRASSRRRVAAGAGDQAFDPDSPMDDGNPLGTPEAEITWQVDTSDYLGPAPGLARGAPQPGHRHRGHARRCPPSSSRCFFGREHYIEPGVDTAHPRCTAAVSD